MDTYAQIALEKAIKEYQGTVLMVTHDFYTVANCADRILLLENGTVREQSGRAYRKSIYKKYFESDIFEAERIRVEKEVRIHAVMQPDTQHSRSCLYSLPKDCIFRIP